MILGGGEAPMALEGLPSGPHQFQGLAIHRHRAARGDLEAGFPARLNRSSKDLKPGARVGEPLVEMAVG